MTLSIQKLIKKVIKFLLPIDYQGHKLYSPHQFFPISLSLSLSIEITIPKLQLKNLILVKFGNRQREQLVPQPSCLLLIDSAIKKNKEKIKFQLRF